MSVTVIAFEVAEQPVAVFVAVTTYVPKALNKPFAGVIEEAVTGSTVPFNVHTYV